MPPEPSGARMVYPPTSAPGDSPTRSMTARYPPPGGVRRRRAAGAASAGGRRRVTLSSGRHQGADGSVTSAGYDLVVVANRLPVDVTLGDDGKPSWTRSPGGLVTALEPVVQQSDGAWVGWGGSADLELEPFDADDMRLVPVKLTEDDLTLYYEGFSNDTLWPLYQEVTKPPTFHRQWWDAYQRVNRRFADAAAAQ